MADQDKDSKTEDATPFKKDELRRKGDIAQSKEVGSAILLLGVSILFYFYGGKILDDMRNILRDFFTRAETFRLTDGNAVDLLINCLGLVAGIVAPIFLFCMVIGFLANVAQTGFIFTGEKLKPNLNKINPLSGFKRILSMKSIVEAVKTVLKMTVISGVIYSLMKGDIEQSIFLMDQSVPQIVSYIGLAIFKTIIYVACLMVIVAVLDFFYQKFNFARDSKMSKQEIKDEHKNREGDPHVKSRIRTLQRRAATNRMMQDIPNAQAIITNPTHLAIAIQYNKDMGAPKVIAKGADFIAEKIRKIAKENDIPLVENKPLARMLYKTVKVGQYIPENLYNAVAEVLAYVMKIKNRMAETLLGEDSVNRDAHL